jgi:two-component system OmpR family sensor kinase
VRIPIRIRLSLIFAASTALVLGVLGVFLYVYLRSDLTASIDQGLRQRSQLVTVALPRLAQRNIPVGGAYVQPDEAFIQLLDNAGNIVDSTPNVRNQPLLTSGQLETVAGAAYFTQRLRGFDDPIRLFATTYATGPFRGYLIVGATLGDNIDAQNSLVHRYLVGGILACLAVGVAGWWLVRAALTPVERIRREASVISLSEPAGRLPVPEANDELRRLATTLNSMLDGLREAYDHERRFIAYASHELRTPLTALKGELELALERPRDADALRSAIASAGEEADRLIGLSEALLTLASARDGRVPVQRVEQPLRAFAEGAVAAVAIRSTRAGVPIHIESDDTVARLDPLLVRQALTNLLDNALRHSPHDGDVVVVARRIGTQVCLSVEDRGEGFPPKFLPHAFEPFSRAQHVSPGAGLGLAVVAAIVEGHGGSVAAENRAEGGARVVISIPDL